jgi:ribosomal protein L34E
MLILQGIDGYETSAWCAVCGEPLRIHERKRGTERRGENDPGFTTDHIVVHGTSLCANCLAKFLVREVALDVLAYRSRRDKYSRN